MDDPGVEGILAREGRAFPGASYREAVLERVYENARDHLLDAMLAANRAHLIMLSERGLIPRAEAATVMAAVVDLDERVIRRSTYTGEFEDLFFYVENLISERAGEPAGNLHLARSRNDLGVATYRMALREKLLRTERSLLSLKESVLGLAGRHVRTVMPAHTHTQQAQPTTLAHYLAAVHDSLARDLRRLNAAYENCNRSPLGAAALATTGFAIDRDRLAELLAFDGLVENSYDAIGGADYLGEIATALQLTFLGLGRFVQDLLLWSTREFGVVRVADPYVQGSSIMPQKRNPVSLEHARSLLSAGVGDTNTALTMLHNTPFGDIVDTEDDAQPYLWRVLDTSDKLFRLLAAVVGTMDVDHDVLLDRAGSGYATVTELADTLVRERGLPFRTGHAVAASVVKLAEAEGTGISPDGVDRAAREILGRPLGLNEDEISRSLYPVAFVEARSVRGGPAPEEMERALAQRREEHAEARSRHQKRVERVHDALHRLDETARSWARQ